MIPNQIKLILNELQQVFSTPPKGDLELGVSHILSADTIVCAGAGRVGLSMAGFAKRLMHLGKNSYYITDDCVSRIDHKSLLIIGSGSGETKSILHMAHVARKHSARILLITGNEDSSMSAVADCVFVLNSPTWIPSNRKFASQQPMTTLFEQSIGIFCDGLVLELMQRMNFSESDMKLRHNVLE